MSRRPDHGPTPPDATIPAGGEDGPERLLVNGVHGATGEYLSEPITYEEAAERLRECLRRAAEASLAGPELEHLRHSQEQPHLGLRWGLDPTRLSEAGWAVVFHQDEDAAVRQALAPLIEHRQRAAPGCPHVLEYRDGQSATQFLAQYAASIYDIDPKQAPYYLLLVGVPDRIPFGVAYELDTQYSVGVLSFDSADAYARYAQSVVSYETSPRLETRREALFFGTRHPYDDATQVSSRYLVEPLARAVEDGRLQGGDGQRFRTRSLTGPAATKAALKEVFQGGGTAGPPALLFAATHGLVWSKDDPRQRRLQGALLCQDWSGPKSISEEHFFSAADVPADARLQGMFAIFFACCSAGTPEMGFSTAPSLDRLEPLAERAFLSPLPQALLAPPGGDGALACVGHVDRAWESSVRPAGVGPQIQAFEHAVGGLLSGKPIGHAMGDLNLRYASTAVRISELHRRILYGARVPDRELLNAWIDYIDAQGYLVVGDPATRLRLEEQS